MIYFIRHGYTDWNTYKNIEGIVDPKCQGLCDISLNDLGISQALEIKKQINNVKFDRVFCSPLKRARQTLELIYDGDAIIKFDKRLLERDFGEFEGLSRTEFNFEDFWNINCNQNFEKAENLNIFCKRVFNFFDSLKVQKNSNILIVSHGGVGMVATSYFSNLPVNGDYSNNLIENGSIKIFENQNEI